MSGGGGTVYPLVGNQRGAADPIDNVWLSASAGTGKTQVLSARVLRLLLRKDVEPSQILCLTFTKAGAAEMANRINAVLARWVRLEDTKLFKELGDLGAEQTDEVRERARTLFASVLDCPGGGLRIDTIHAFSQWLLSSFPTEADLPPGARPMEDRERELLAREVLADMLTDAEARGNTATLDAVSLITTRKDPAALRQWLMRCASNAEMWEGPGAWQTPMRMRVHSLLEIPADADMEWANEGLHPEFFPDSQIRAMIEPLEEWGTKTADKCLDFIRDWLSRDVSLRADAIAGFRGTLLKADGTPSLTLKKPREDDPGFARAQDLVADAVALFDERRSLLDLADFLTPALELGRAFFLRWDEAKKREGLLDFDDLIRQAAALLKSSLPADWIRYKLDRRFDHILIDEAQDTNQAQWDIVDALIDDFFTGQGASGDKLRTIFTVGDYKQAIFGFQGTSPENYERAKVKIWQRIMDARENALNMRERGHVPAWEELDLGQSFRTSAPVLEFVNKVIETLGAEVFGLPDTPRDHEGADRPGLVTIWNTATAAMVEHQEEDDARDWLPPHETVLAEKIAEQVRRWVDLKEPLVLAKGDAPRHADAGDVMVLVRKRGKLAAQIVAQLHAKGVPVAGVDRLRLGAPLAVKDLMAALRFAAQPLDDLSLANLLGSPLIGWSQDDLLEYVPRGRDERLWAHLRQHKAPFVQQTVERLKPLLARADYETPQSLLAWLLTGSWEGRARLVERLGSEANDPIDELVNAAFGYESAHTPSLAGFIEWFDAGEGELKREADDAVGQVRVMTVHGSKGLQAPIVILADATGKPGESGDLELDDAPLGQQSGRMVPLPPLSKDERVGPVMGAQKTAQGAAMEEHWRLLYVAMTRAEEALFIGGSLGRNEAKRGEPHEDSWYARLLPLFEGQPLEDDLWDARRECGDRADALVSKGMVVRTPAQTELPKWATTAIGPEPRPPRPLAPSSAGEELSAEPPLASDPAKAAARRGVLIHRLLERLPDLDPTEREAKGEAWLQKHAAELDESERTEMLSSALSVLDHPGFSELFSPAALPEVPLAATVDGIVVSGTVDRLLVTEDRVIVVDFKTSRRPPVRMESVSAATLRQMAAYVAALETIYPAHSVTAALLYTQTAKLFEIPADLLTPHKQRLGDAQQSYVPLDIE